MEVTIKNSEWEDQESNRKDQIMDQMKKLGQYLRTLRKELGFSMYEVARRSNLTPSYISKIEKGNNFSSITIKTLVNFSKVYDIPIISILEKAGFTKGGFKNGLPQLNAFLKIRYDFSPQQVRDMLTAFEIVEKKYKK